MKMKKEKENSLMVKMIKNNTQKQMIWVIQRSAKNLYYKKTQSVILNHPYYKTNFKSLDLSRASFFYYNRERNRLNRQKERLKHNKKLLAIQNDYPLINLQDLAFYSILVGLFNFRGVSKDFEKLEKIVSIVLNQEQGITINDKFRNQKYIKHIQNEHKNIDVLAIASYLNEIKEYTFRSKEQAEYLDSIIKIILNIPIGLTHKLGKLKDWQIVEVNKMKKVEQEIVKTYKLIDKYEV